MPVTGVGLTSECSPVTLEALQTLGTLLYGNTARGLQREATLGSDMCRQATVGACRGLYTRVS